MLSRTYLSIRPSPTRTCVSRIPFMKVGVIPENPIERLVLALGIAPAPLFETMGAMLLARTVIVATKLGVFEALAGGSLSPAASSIRGGADLQVRRQVRHHA